MSVRWEVREGKAASDLATVCYRTAPGGFVQVYWIRPKNIEGKDEAWAALLAHEAEAAIRAHLQTDYSTAAATEAVNQSYNPACYRNGHT
jgi:hypothetical protein